MCHSENNLDITYFVAKFLQIKRVGEAIHSTAISVFMFHLWLQCSAEIHPLLCDSTPGGGWHVCNGTTFAPWTGYGGLSMIWSCALCGCFSACVMLLRWFIPASVANYCTICYLSMYINDWISSTYWFGMAGHPAHIILHHVPVMRCWHPLHIHLLWQSLPTVFFHIMSLCDFNFYSGILLQLLKHDFRGLHYDFYTRITLVYRNVTWFIYLQPVVLPVNCMFDHPCTILCMCGSDVTVCFWLL